MSSLEMTGVAMLMYVVVERYVAMVMQLTGLTCS